MGRKNLRRIILFGSLVTFGLLVVQGFWFKRAFDIEERQFNHTVQIALKNIADTIVAENRDVKPSETHIKQLSSNFFFAELNTVINPNLLDRLIKKELAIRRLKVDYEIGIYKASDDTIVYGAYIPATIRWQIEHAADPPESSQSELSNFAILFPNKFSVIAGELDIWIFSTIILFFMAFFFVYAILMLLKERRLAEIKEDFINNLTHEFKTPIANIELAGEALKNNRVAPEKQQQYFQIIHSENQRLKAQVERVLQMGTIDKHNLQLDLKLVNIHDLIRKPAEHIGMRVSEKTGELKMELNAHHPEILADEFHLTNTVYNVLDNAEKYSKANPQISISTQDEKGGLLITVVDAGIGIKEDFQKLVFDKFFRVPTGNVHNVKGFGLGLSYVKNVIEAHRGKISLHSRLNHGSRFDIFLPYR
jgi:two-component system, OmpR family, phosphate regulon sensor histidine kinase PhoR